MIVGARLFVAIVVHEATENGKAVLVIDQRFHIAESVYIVIALKYVNDRKLAAACVETLKQIEEKVR